MTDPTPKPKPPSLAQGATPSRNEIMDALSDEGYSADERKEWLKTVLTELAADKSEDPEKVKLAKEIKNILREQLPGESIADDTL